MLDRWQRIEEIFHAACELEPEARSSFVKEACADDHSLRLEVESLLACIHKQADIIDHPPNEEVFRLIAADQDNSLAGQVIAHYKIIGQLGEGGMGEVYLAEDTRLERKVALKLLPRFLTQDEDRVRRLHQEARDASALNHPNLITIHDIGQADSRHFIAMEFVSGQTLRQRMKFHRMPLREVLDIAIQVASGLAVAHHAGIIHRDIKPENIMVRDDGCVKVLDFGIAKLKEREALAPESEDAKSPDRTPKRSAMWGTVSYMSPEQVRREEVDHRSDLFSLGVVLYEMVTGQRPFEGEPEAGALTSVLNDDPRPIAERRPGVPRGLETIVSTSLEKNREDRYQSANELLGDLERLRSQLETGAAERSRGPDSRIRLKTSRRWPRRTPGFQRAVKKKHWFLVGGVIAALTAALDALPLTTEAGSHVRDSLLIVLALALGASYAYLRRKRLTYPAPDSVGGAFRGLAPFQEEDRERFYGRDNDVAALIGMVAQSQFRFGVLYGDSGTGKSSLLTAGVIPRLNEEGFLPIYCRWYKDPLVGLIEECTKRSATEPRYGEAHINYLSRLCEEKGAGLVIVCDQFEEFFVSFKSKREREPFVSFVEAVYLRTDLPVKFLFSIRADFLYLITSEFDRRIPEPLMSDRRYHLRLLAQEHAEEIIEKSARAASLPLEPSLCHQVAVDLTNDEEVLPSELQIVGSQVQRKCIYTLEAYRRAGGKDQLVHGFLEDAIQQAESREAAELVLRSLISDENTRVTLPLKEVTKRTQRDQGLVARTLRLFVDHRLIREIQEDEPWRYEVMHEYLIPMINRSTAKVMDARQRANLKFQRHRLDHQLKQSHRIPLREWWFIRRYSDIERGEPERDLLNKSLRWGLVKATALFLLLAVLTTAAAALLSRGEEWEEAVLRDGHKAAVRRAVFSPDGKLLVSGGDDGKVIVWDFARRERIATFTDHTDVVNALAFSPDGKWFASGSYDRTVIVWNAARLEKEVVLSEHRGRIGALGFSPDGRLLASGSTDSDVRTVLWEVGSWRKLRELPIGSEYCSMLFSHDGRELSLSAAAAPGKATWDVATGRSLPDRFEADWGGAGGAFSPDGMRMVAVDDRGNVKFSDVFRKKLLTSSRGHRDNGRAAAFSPDGRLAATGAEDIVLWDTVKLTKLLPLEYASVVWSLAFSPDGRWLVSTHGDGAILVWEVLERRLAANLNGHSGPVRAVAFSANGKRLASASEDGSVIIWDAQHRAKEAVLVGHDTRVMGVAFSPDGDWLASCDQDGTVICWDRGKRQPRWIVRSRSRYDRTAFCVAVSPDGRWIAASPGVYESSDGRQFLYFDGSQDWAPANSIYGMAFSQDGGYLVYPTTSGQILVWSTQTWQIIDRLDSPGAGSISISISPDGKLLVTGDVEKRVHLWGVFPLRDLGVLGQHAASIKSVAFSPDGKEIVSASDDGTIALWNVGGRRLITRIGTHAAPVISVAFSPDGKQIASGEHDKSVRLYTRHTTLLGRRWDWPQWLK